MKKKIIIISHAMYIGGAERALLGLLDSFNYDKYDVDLFLMRHEGELLKYVPKEVNLLEETDCKYLSVPIEKLIKDRKYKILLNRIKGKFIAIKKSRNLKIEDSSYVQLLYSHKYTYKCFEHINPEKEYDLAISFLTPHYICEKKINAKKKVAWIHTDYSTIEIDVKSELSMWNSYDNIVSISDSVTKSFLIKFPSLESKILRIDNILSAQTIKTQADVLVNDMIKIDNEIQFLSVGRFCHAKNFENIPEICSILLGNNFNIKWYIIGYGNYEDLIKQNIKKYKIDKNVILLGKKENPYPYIKQCDFYVQPSRYEGKAVTVTEALILNKLVIITNYPTSTDQIEDLVEGKIVNLDNQKCAEEIIMFLNNKNLQEKIKKYIEKKEYSNNFEIEKLYDLIT